MPKMKTNRAAAKRMKITGKGKIAYKPVGRRHLNSSKSSKRKRHLNFTLTVDTANLKGLKRCLPYR